MDEAPERHRSVFTEGLIAVGLSVFFLWGLRLLPLMAVFAIPGAALPLARFGGRRGGRAALVASLCMAAASAGVAALIAGAARGSAALVGAPRPAVEFFTIAGSVGAIAVAATLFRGRTSAGFLALAAWGSILFSAYWFADQPRASRELSAAMDSTIQSLTAQAGPPGAETAAVRENIAALNSARRVAIAAAPGLFSVAWILLAAPGYFLGRRLGGAPEGFSQFQLPPGLAILFVAGGAGTALLRGVPRHVAADVLIPVAVLYFVAGLSIICHFARRAVKTAALRVILYVVASWIPFCAATAGVGLFDWYFDFRHRAEKRKGDTP